MNYGPVIIINGKHRGKFGLYDDEDDDGKPIIYLWGGKPVTTEVDEIAGIKIMTDVDQWFIDGTIGKSI